MVNSRGGRHVVGRPGERPECRQHWDLDLHDRHVPAVGQPAVGRPRQGAACGGRPDGRASGGERPRWGAPGCVPTSGRPARITTCSRAAGGRRSARPAPCRSCRRSAEGPPVLVGGQCQFPHSPVLPLARRRELLGLRRLQFQADGFAQVGVEGRGKVRIEQQSNDSAERGRLALQRCSQVRREPPGGIDLPLIPDPTSGAAGSAIGTDGPEDPAHAAMASGGPCTVVDDAWSLTLREPVSSRGRGFSDGGSKPRGRGGAGRRLRWWPPCPCGRAPRGWRASRGSTPRSPTGRS